jgi:predicted TIM-barrel fold metal-dependent hydrolase
VAINDAHCHFFSPTFFETLGREAGPRFERDAAISVPEALGWDPPESPARLTERWIRTLDAHDVRRAVLIASAPGDEDSIAEAVRIAPSRVIGFFMVNPLAEDAPARVRRAIEEQGLRGVCLFPAMHRYSLHDPRVAAVVEPVASRPGCAVFVHCGVLTIGARRKLGLPSPFEARYGQPLDVQALAAAWPSATFVIPHFGAGLFREALMAAAMCPNVYLDTSSSNAWTSYTPGLTLRDVFRHAAGVAGSERLLFGTDSSFFPRGWQRPIYDAQLAAAAGANLSSEDIERIFAANLDRLFPLSG